MEKDVVVLDACVLYPMYLRDILLSTAEAGLYLPCWSEKILEEATGKLVSKGIKTFEEARQFGTVIKEAFPEAMVEIPFGLEKVMTNDSKDRHVLAAAVVAKADIIVTDNISDFKPEDLAPWNVKAQSADDFLTDLFQTYPDSIVQVVRQNCNKYTKPKRTFVELLEFLANRAKVPNFANQVLFYEYCDFIVQTAKKALSKIGMPAPEGGQFYEGERYRLWQKRKILMITAKDGRGEILRVQDRQIEGNILSQDVIVFQNFAENLDQELEKSRDSP